MPTLRHASGDALAGCSQLSTGTATPASSREDQEVTLNAQVAGSGWRASGLSTCLAARHDPGNDSEYKKEHEWLTGLYSEPQ
jgi:hypothetical protein